MNIQRFSTGNRFVWNGNMYEITRLLPDGKLNLEEFRSGAVLIVERRELIEAWNSGKLRFLTKSLSDHTGSTEIQYELTDYPDEAVAKARFRLHVIEPILRLPARERTHAAIDDRLREIQNETAMEPAPGKFSRGLSRRSVYRMIECYTRSGNDIRSLMDNYSRCGGAGQARLSPEVSNLITSVINDLYFRPETVTIDDILHETALRLAEENHFRSIGDQLRMPARSTISRRIDALDMRAKFEAKHGERATMHAFDQVNRMEYPERPLQRVEIDDTKTDVIVVDERDGLPLGRPTFTYAIDVATRYPLGYYIGFEPPSYYAVMECLYQSICPKLDIRSLYGAEHNWICDGIPETLVIDNGRQYIGRDLDNVCAALGVTLIFSPVRTPEFKATVERGFSSFNTGLFHTIPGTTFSNVAERADYDSVGNAVVTLTELEAMLNIFIVDIYAERFHKGLEGIPARRWEEAIRGAFSPRLPASKDDLRILLGRVEHRMIQRYGIDFLHIRYNSPELSPIRMRLKGEKVKFKFHSGDLSRIYVNDPFEGRYIEIPALDQEYTSGLSVWKHRIVRNMAVEDGKRVDMDSLGRAKRKLRKFYDEIRSRKSPRTRMQMARWDRGGQPQSVGKEAAADNVCAAPHPAIAVEADESVFTDDSDWTVAYIPK